MKPHLQQRPRTTGRIPSPHRAAAMLPLATVATSYAFVAALVLLL